MAKFYHVYIDPKPDVTPDQVKEKMDLALDWFRYGPRNWIVYTTSDANKLHARLKDLVETGGNLFIVKLEVSDRQGYITKRLWDWLKKDRAKQISAGRSRQLPKGSSSQTPKDS